MIVQLNDRSRRKEGWIKQQPLFHSSNVCWEYLMFSKWRKQFGDSNFLKIFNCFNRINIAASISCLLPPHCRNCTWCSTSKDPGHQNQRLYSYLTSCSALCCLWLKTYIQKSLLEQGNTLRCGSHNDIYIAPHLQEWYTSACSSISPPKKYSIVYNT